MRSVSVRGGHVPERDGGSRGVWGVHWRPTLWRGATRSWTRSAVRGVGLGGVSRVCGGGTRQCPQQFLKSKTGLR
eukprot:3761514-Rhodomonas_salina.1